MKGKRRRYGDEYRLRAVRLHEEEGYSYQLLTQELGCSSNTLRRWLSCYREYGEEGLKHERLEAQLGIIKAA